MAGGVRGKSVRHRVLVSPRSSFHSVSRPESVFQDIQGVAAALTLNFPNRGRVQLFPIRRLKVANIQRPINTRRNCSRVDAALEENLEFFVCFKVYRPLAQAIGISQSKELDLCTKPIIRLPINQSTAWCGLGRPGATVFFNVLNRINLFTG